MFSDESGAKGSDSCMMAEKTGSGLKKELVGARKSEISGDERLREGRTAFKRRADVALRSRFCFIVRASA
jgi:hypothetical protein